MHPTLKELFDLTGKTAMVTGGSGYLGRMMVEALAEAGATVLMADIQETALAAAAKEFAPGLKIVPICGDMLSETGIRQCFAKAIAQLGQLDILVNCAYAGPTPELDEAAFADFAKGLETSVAAYAFTAQLAAREMRQAGGGSIVNIGSMYGQVTGYPEVYKDIAKPNSVVYQTGKAGILHLTKYMAVYWAKDRIRVNAISPGPFPHPHADKKMDTFRERLSQKSPMGRIGEAWEIKGAVVFLASQASSYITGQNIQVDGGWTVW